MSDNCIFCKIAKGEIPSTSIYEDDDFKVILDLAPATPGHALIIPKKHFANLYELDDEMAAEILPLARDMAAKMTKALGCTGFNLVQNNGETAGQTEFHFHLHLIPRYGDDAVGEMWEHLEISDTYMEDMRNKIVGE